LLLPRPRFVLLPALQLLALVLFALLALLLLLLKLAVDVFLVRLTGSAGRVVHRTLAPVLLAPVLFLPLQLILLLDLLGLLSRSLLNVLLAPLPLQFLLLRPLQLLRLQLPLLLQRALGVGVADAHDGPRIHHDGSLRNHRRRMPYGTHGNRGLRLGLGRIVLAFAARNERHGAQAHREDLEGAFGSHAPPYRVGQDRAAGAS
jgi:hypothetical protein